MRRVVVSGMGAVTPLGGDLDSTWKNLIANKSGANLITKFDTNDFHWCHHLDTQAISF